MQKWYTNKVLLNTLNLHNDRWVYWVSATFPSNQAIGTYRLLSCGNNGYDQGCCENHDGHAKNRKVIQR